MAMPLKMPDARTTKVVVATSAMLSFISFWRAAAIVLNDLGSSAYYVGGIAEQATGRAAPWFGTSINAIDRSCTAHESGHADV